MKEKKKVNVWRMLRTFTGSNSHNANTCVTGTQKSQFKIKITTDDDPKTIKDFLIEINDTVKLIHQSGLLSIEDLSPLCREIL